MTTTPPPGWRTSTATVLPRHRPPVADLGRRLLARVVDQVLVGAVLIALLLLLLLGGGAFDSTTTSAEPYSALGVLLGVVGWFGVAATVSVLYETLLVRRDGQTLGKKLLKIRVVATDGSTPTGGAALGRCLVGNLGIIDVAFCLWDRPLRRCLHDHLASTVVVAA